MTGQYHQRRRSPQKLLPQLFQELPIESEESDSDFEPNITMVPPTPQKAAPAHSVMSSQQRPEDAERDEVQESQWREEGSEEGFQNKDTLTKIWKRKKMTRGWPGTKRQNNPEK